MQSNDVTHGILQRRQFIKLFEVKVLKFERKVHRFHNLIIRRKFREMFSKMHHDFDHQSDNPNTVCNELYDVYEIGSINKPHICYSHYKNDDFMNQLFVENPGYGILPSSIVIIESDSKQNLQNEQPNEDKQRFCQQLTAQELLSFAKQIAIGMVRFFGSIRTMKLIDILSLFSFI